MFKLDKKFIKTLMLLAIPIILQSLVTASLNLLDNLMIGSLGENEIAAVGISNQFYMLYYYTIMGITLGAGIFMSQFWGKKDVTSIHKFLGISLVVGMISTIFFAILAFFFPEMIMKIFIDENIVIEQGVAYLKMVALSYIFTTISLAYAAALRSIGQTKIPMYGSLVGLVFNGILNYIFIFGKFGAPVMGVAGAALGTTVSRFMELAFILFIIYKNKNVVAGKISQLLDFNFDLVKRYFITATPVVFNDVMWIAGITAYFIAYSKLGINATATMQIANTINNVFNIFGIGIASASAILIGNKIGAGKEEDAKEDAVKISVFGVLVGIIIGILFFVLAPFIAMLFKITPETYNNVIFVLRVMAIVLPLRFFGITQIIGVLRGGGDVMYAIVTELVAVWLIGVPLSFVGAVYFKLPITIVYILVCLEEPFKAIATYPRLRSGKWIKNLVKN
ncbi:MATE family efflux transporter [uncultured Fusobacterium sp.]|uniref:MATE family efflux transporter n=1 Tax=uncultured Fusobacterium sp. TaxID=159267 RepID=UPI0025E758DC|nr:MATE family efflux transporter [uncultured Fusobacterium sp.]